MKDWIRDNLVKSFSAFGIIIAIVSFLAGVWNTQDGINDELLLKELKIEALKKEIQDLKDGVIWDIRQWIANPSNYR